MRVATAKRKVEQFQTQVTLPEWQLEPDNEAYFGNEYDGQFVDENGMPIDPPEERQRPDVGGEPPVDDVGAAPPEERRDRIGDLVESITGRRPESDSPPPRERRRERPPQESRPNQ